MTSHSNAAATRKVLLAHPLAHRLGFRVNRIDMSRWNLLQLLLAERSRRRVNLSSVIPVVARVSSPSPSFLAAGFQRRLLFLLFSEKGGGEEGGEACRSGAVLCVYYQPPAHGNLWLSLQTLWILPICLAIRRDSLRTWRPPCNLLRCLAMTITDRRWTIVELGRRDLLRPLVTPTASGRGSLCRSTRPLSHIQRVRRIHRWFLEVTRFVL